MTLDYVSRTSRVEKSTQGNVLPYGSITWKASWLENRQRRKKYQNQNRSTINRKSRQELSRRINFKPSSPQSPCSIFLKKEQYKDFGNISRFLNQEKILNGITVFRNILSKWLTPSSIGHWSSSGYTSCTTSIKCSLQTVQCKQSLKGSLLYLQITSASREVKSLSEYRELQLKHSAGSPLKPEKPLSADTILNFFKEGGRILKTSFAKDLFSNILASDGDNEGLKGADEKTYLGNPGSILPFRRDDHDCIMVDYMRSGSPRLWIAISLESTSRFESIIREACLENRSLTKCGQWIRHLAIFIDPRQLEKQNITFQTYFQRPNDLVMIEAGCYYAALDLGGNLSIRAMHRNFTFGTKSHHQSKSGTRDCSKGFDCPHKSIKFLRSRKSKVAIRRGPIKVYNLKEVDEIS